LEQLRATKSAILADVPQPDENQLVTRGVRIDGNALAGDADAIREAVIKSVGWNSDDATADDQTFLKVTADYVIVRNKVKVVRQVLATLRDLSVLPASQGQRGRGNGFGP
jgi:hypothetical protein